MSILNCTDNRIRLLLTERIFLGLPWAPSVFLKIVFTSLTNVQKKRSFWSFSSFVDVHKPNLMQIWTKYVTDYLTRQTILYHECRQKLFWCWARRCCLCSYNRSTSFTSIESEWFYENSSTNLDRSAFVVLSTDS